MAWLCSCSRRASSATNSLSIAGPERDISARTCTKLRRILLHGFDHPIGPGVGVVAMPASRGHARATRRRFSIKASRSMMGIGPQLAQLQRSDGLIRGHERCQTFRGDPAVDVRDQFQRDVVDARKIQPTARRSSRGNSGYSSWADGAAPCGFALRSNRNCRAAIRRPATCAGWPATAADDQLIGFVQNRFVLRPTGSEDGPARAAHPPDANRPRIWHVSPTDPC